MEHLTWPLDDSYDYDHFAEAARRDREQQLPTVEDLIVLTEETIVYVD